MNIFHFGEALLHTKDLDPIYCMLKGSEMSDPQTKRWLLAYWMFYHAGVSSRISEATDFWAACRYAYDEKWPRGVERRHFRGQKALDAINVMSAKSPEYIVDWLMGDGDSFQHIKDRCMKLPQFGPWISWKVADMIERVLGVPVDFSDCSLDMYRDPSMAVSLYVTGDKRAKITKDQFNIAVNELLSHFSSFDAPPYHDRACNIQEVETILCKWKSHIGGHYPLGKDTKDIKDGLVGWGKTAEKLLLKVNELGVI